jgi:hypothetical protein
MYKKYLLTAILMFALVTMACGVNFNLPINEVKTGPTQTDEISVPMPDTNETIDLSLSFGAGELEVQPLAQGTLVSGTATYNVPDFKPIIESTGNQVEITQGNLEIKGIPDFENNIKNEWDLKINPAAAINLSVKAGAYSGKYELGGLSLENLDITDGAADVNVAFSEPNVINMEKFSYNTGASNVTLEGLGNANFETMVFKGGAGSYRLVFDGALRQDAVISVESGISSMTIVVPEGVPAQVTFEGGLSNIQAFGAWEQSGDTYSMEGTGAKLTIIVKMGAGTLELRNK